MAEKPIVWLGSSLEDLRGFPDDARRAAGYLLGRVQHGLLPTDCKPMVTVGPGVVEIRIRTRLAHRVFYVAKFDEAVYVLSAFEKKTRKTPPAEIALARLRLGELLGRRRRQAETR
ncbi:MAG: type II toxin-antitoxin system RelE/ParE family toxin [Vicinamibacterales bacterium]